jgi:hypothetical protein
MFVMASKKVSYWYLFPGAEPTNGERSSAELICERPLQENEAMPRHAIGDVVQLPDILHGDEERSFKVLSEGNLTISRFVEDPSTVTENLNVYVTDAEQEDMAP